MTSNDHGPPEHPGATAAASLAAGAAAGFNLPALRGHNAALVLGLLRAAGEEGVSRLELAARTALTPQAVSKITARLRAEGLAVEAGRRASTGGKPATLLRLVPGARHAIGIHLDRDEAVLVLADLAGAPVAVRRAPLDLTAGAGPVLTAVAREVAAVRAEADAPGVLGAGVACPGPLDHTTGVLRRVTGAPGWDGFPLRDALAARLDLPVVVDKDTNAAALALAHGPGRPGSFAYLHLGTGLGAGLVLDGALYRGPRTGAGEFGHQVVWWDGPRCACGRRGCVEALCLAALARDDLPGAARALGVGAANLVELLDIDRILLGGRTVATHPDVFLRGVTEELTDRAAARGSARPSVAVVPADGPGTVAQGAAQLILGPLFGASSGSAAVPQRGVVSEESEVRAMTALP
ncbi:ROK family transcriptional regulator [Streptomyces sp. NBC_01525]|uniref:ROK family transcriptional regulator n=1 Tax=Streptomyces sp. NBC_01525 TaxID=2903893 RepID=UPI00386B6D78